MVYASLPIRRFVGVDRARKSASDATKLLMFRRLLKVHDLTRRILEAINAHLFAKGLLL